MTATFSETLLRDDGTDVTVEFTQSQYYPATGPSWDDPGSPAEGGEIEIVGIFTLAGPVKPSEAEMQRFYDELYSMPPHVHEPDPDYEMDFRRENRGFLADPATGEDF